MTDRARTRKWGWRSAAGGWLVVALAACGSTVVVSDGAPSDETDASCAEPAGGPCPTSSPGLGVCSQGVLVCDDGALICAPVAPSAEDCTTSDDESCDGQGACTGLAQSGASSSAPGLHVGYGVAALGDGLVVTGAFEGTLDLGAAPLQSNDAQDAFVIALDADGVPRWSLAGGGKALGSGVVVTPSGEIVVAGDFWGSLDFGAGGLASQGDLDVFLLRLSAEGTPLSSTSFGGAKADRVNRIALLDDGAVALVGETGGVAADVTLRVVEPDGTLRWQRVFESATRDSGLDVATSGERIAVVGACTGSTDWGPVVAGNPGPCGGSADGFLTVLDADEGTTQWVRLQTSIGPALTKGVAAAPDGSWVVAGYFEGELALGDDLLLEEVAGFETFVARYDAGGVATLGKRFGAPNARNHARDVEVDGAGNIVLLGTHDGPLSFGGPAIAHSDSPAQDVYIAKLLPSGEHVWSVGLGGGIQQRAQDAALAPLGDVLVTGDFYGELDLGLGQVLAAPPKGHGLFVARFDP